MKRLPLPSLGLVLACLCGGREAEAQVYSQNVVGYYNQPIFAGNNLIANQLGNGGNTLSEIFTAPVPEGSTFTEWDATAGQYLPPSVYDTADGWSINYVLMGRAACSTPRRRFPTPMLALSGPVGLFKDRMRRRS